MREELHQSILAGLRGGRMCAPGERIAVAVSGGADSVALFLLLMELRTGLGISLSVAHFNHQLRAAASDDDQSFVEQLATQHDCPFIATRADVAAAAQGEGVNLEEMGRRLRYKFFEDVVREGRATRVAVGHTADDQAETVLAHILRGTGLTGVGGIHPIAGVVIRPLLQIRRAALRDYLNARGQPWREDATNQDVARLRARIRHQLLPQLERDFQPATVAHLASLADLARDEEQMWRVLADQAIAAASKRTPQGIEIGVADLLQPLKLLPPENSAPLTRRLIRGIVTQVAGHRRRLSAEHVEQVIRLAAESSSGHRVKLPGGVEVQRTFGRLLFAGRDAATEAAAGTSGAPETYDYAVDLATEGTHVEIPAIGARLCLKVIDWPAASGETTLWGQVLDRDLLRAPLRIRNWRPGDAYRPRGRRSVHKLKQLFLDRRIAVSQRHGWPVLTSAEQVVWVREMGPAEEFSAGAATRRAIVITEQAL